MGIFNTIDDRELTQEVLEEHGYVLLQRHKPSATANYVIFRKQIFNQAEVLGQGLQIGIVHSYLDIFMFLNSEPKYRFRARLGYMVPAGDHRVIMGGHMKTESDLSYEELWAKTTSVAINKDRVDGTFNWQKYERNR